MNKETTKDDQNWMY